MRYVALRRVVRTEFLLEGQFHKKHVLRSYPDGAMRETDGEDKIRVSRRRLLQKIMSLKFRCKAKGEVPAEVQGLYVEREGEFLLDVEGAVDKARVDEVRASNVALASQLAEQKKRFESIESEQVKAIAAERDGLSARLTAVQVDQGVVTVATKKGLRPSAIPVKPPPT